MSCGTLREQYKKAIQYDKVAFIERPLIGSPAAPAQAETQNRLWYVFGGCWLVAYEYTHWWKESLALRKAAMLADWSWLEKVRVTGPEAARLLNYGSVTDLSKAEEGHIKFIPMVNENGWVALEGVGVCISKNDWILSQNGSNVRLKLLEETHQDGRETGGRHA